MEETIEEVKTTPKRKATTKKEAISNRQKSVARTRKVKAEVDQLKWDEIYSRLDERYVKSELAIKRSISDNIFKFSRTRNVTLPTRAHADDAGIDFYIPNDAFGGKKEFDLKPNHDILIPSGIIANVPKDHAMIFFNKSGVATKLKLCVAAQVVDESYKGEIHIHVFNYSNKITKLFIGTKIIQGILIKMNYLIPVEVPKDELYIDSTKTERGDGGFGSTGV